MSKQLYFACLWVAQILLFVGYLYALDHNRDEWVGLSALFVMFTAMLVASRLSYDRYLRIGSEQAAKNNPKQQPSDGHSGK